MAKTMKLYLKDISVYKDAIGLKPKHSPFMSMPYGGYTSLTYNINQNSESINENNIYYNVNNQIQFLNDYKELKLSNNVLKTNLNRISSEIVKHKKYTTRKKKINVKHMSKNEDDTGWPSIFNYSQTNNNNKNSSFIKEEKGISNLNKDEKNYLQVSLSSKKISLDLFEYMSLNLRINEILKKNINIENTNLKKSNLMIPSIYKNTRLLSSVFEGSLNNYIHSIYKKEFIKEKIGEVLEQQLSIKNAKYHHWESDIINGFKKNHINYNSAKDFSKYKDSSLHVEKTLEINKINLIDNQADNFVALNSRSQNTNPYIKYVSSKLIIQKYLDFKILGNTIRPILRRNNNQYSNLLKKSFYESSMKIINMSSSEQLDMNLNYSSLKNLIEQENSTSNIRENNYETSNKNSIYRDIQTLIMSEVPRFTSQNKTMKQIIRGSSSTSKNVNQNTNSIINEKNINKITSRSNMINRKNINYVTSKVNVANTNISKKSNKFRKIKIDKKAKLNDIENYVRKNNVHYSNFLEQHYKSTDIKNIEEKDTSINNNYKSNYKSDYKSPYENLMDYEESPKNTYNFDEYIFKVITYLSNRDLITNNLGILSEYKLSKIIENELFIENYSKAIRSLDLDLKNEVYDEKIYNKFQLDKKNEFSYYEELQKKNSVNSLIKYEENKLSSGEDLISKIIKNAYSIININQGSSSKDIKKIESTIREEFFENLLTRNKLIELNLFDNKSRSRIAKNIFRKLYNDLDSEDVFSQMKFQNSYLTSKSNYKVIGSKLSYLSGESFSESLEYRALTEEVFTQKRFVENINNEILEKFDPLRENFKSSLTMLFKDNNEISQLLNTNTLIKNNLIKFIKSNTIVPISNVDSSLISLKENLDNKFNYTVLKDEIINKMFLKTINLFDGKSFTCTNTIEEYIQEIRNDFQVKSSLDTKKINFFTKNIIKEKDYIDKSISRSSKDSSIESDDLEKNKGSNLYALLKDMSFLFKNPNINFINNRDKFSINARQNKFTNELLKNVSKGNHNDYFNQYNPIQNKFKDKLKNNFRYYSWKSFLQMRNNLSSDFPINSLIFIRKNSFTDISAKSYETVKSYLKLDNYHQRPMENFKVKNFGFNYQLKKYNNLYNMDFTKDTTKLTKDNLSKKEDFMENLNILIGNNLISKDKFKSKDNFIVKDIFKKINLIKQGDLQEIDKPYSIKKSFNRFDYRNLSPYFGSLSIANNINEPLNVNLFKKKFSLANSSSKTNTFNILLKNIEKSIANYNSYEKNISQTSKGEFINLVNQINQLYNNSQNLILDYSSKKIKNTLQISKSENLSTINENMNMAYKSEIKSEHHVSLKEFEKVSKEVIILKDKIKDMEKKNNLLKKTSKSKSSIFDSLSDKERLERQRRGDF